MFIKCRCPLRYAPWCGHCKSLEPVYASVAAAFAGEPRVVVAKIDGTKNDFDLMPVTGFPALFVFSAHAKNQPKPVSGRDAHSLIQAVVSNSAFKDLKVMFRTTNQKHETRYQNPKPKP